MERTLACVEVTLTAVTALLDHGVLKVAAAKAGGWVVEDELLDPVLTLSTQENVVFDEVAVATAIPKLLQLLVPG